MPVNVFFAATFAEIRKCMTIGPSPLIVGWYTLMSFKLMMSTPRDSDGYIYVLDTLPFPPMVAPLAITACYHLIDWDVK